VAAVNLRREAFLDRGKERGEYDSLQEAERAARVVLALLGAHLVGEVRAQLAARLPEDFAHVVRADAGEGPAGPVGDGRPSPTAGRVSTR
jgi:uncharacterized protein (DUF2267 family)